jgi:branched-chain amino acid transport system substrate-binding protein
MKRAVSTAAAVTALAAVAAFAGTTTAPGATTSASAQRAVNCKDSATIGYFGPTTGPAASIGEEIRRFSLLYAQQWNAAGKKPTIKVVEGDTQLDPAQTSTIAQQFASNKDLIGAIGPGSSPEVVAAAPIFKRAGMAYSVSSATRTSLSDGSNVGFFRIAAPDSVQAKTTTEFMTKRLHVKSVLVTDDQSAYGKPLADEVASLLQKAGVKVKRTSVTQKQSDFSAAITSIPSDTDLVYLAWLLPAKMQLFGVQLKEQGKGKLKLYMSDAAGSGGVTLDGAYFSTFGPFVQTFPQAQNMLKAFYAKYGKKAQVTNYGPLGYISGQTMVDAVARACKDGSATRAEVMQQMFKTNLTTSIIGQPIRYTKRGDRVGAKFFIFQITKNGPITIH